MAAILNSNALWGVQGMTGKKYKGALYGILLISCGRKSENVELSWWNNGNNSALSWLEVSNKKTKQVMKFWFATKLTAQYTVLAPFFLAHYILITGSLLKVEYKLSSLKLLVPFVDITRLILLKTKSFLAALWSCVSLSRGRPPKLCTQYVRPFPISNQRYVC